MAARPLKEIVEPGWAQALEPVAERIAAMGDFLRGEIAAGRTYLPAGANVLRAFQQPVYDLAPGQRGDPLSFPRRAAPLPVRWGRSVSSGPQRIPSLMGRTRPSVPCLPQNSP